MLLFFLIVNVIHSNGKNKHPTRSLYNLLILVYLLGNKLDVLILTFSNTVGKKFILKDRDLISINQGLPEVIKFPIHY